MRTIFFVIPVYKVEEYLERCVNSVIRQSYKNTEIVLVDDGSPDRCPEMCDEYAEKYANINVIHKANGGLSDARNAGIEYVISHADGGDYITFLDSDDFVRESYADRLVSLMEKNGCDMAQCGYEKGEADNFSSAPESGRVFCVSSEEALLGYDLKAYFSTKVYKVRIFADLRFPVGMFNEDEFVLYRAVYAADKIAFTDEKLVYYYQRGGSIMSEIAMKLKNNPHRYDYLKAYKERAEFFAGENKPEQVQRTHEKVCTDIILRYCEQMYLKKSDRDADCVNGGYMRIYRESYKKMITRRGMPLKRKLMYMIFNVCPMCAVLAGKLFTLRK